MSRGGSFFHRFGNFKAHQIPGIENDVREMKRQKNIMEKVGESDKETLSRPPLLSLAHVCPITNSLLTLSTTQIHTVIPETPANTT